MKPATRFDDWSPTEAVAILCALMLGCGLLVVLLLLSGTDRMGVDSAIFNYTGWRMVDGGRLYVDVWEPKLPLGYVIPALVALFVGDHPWIQHWLTTLLTVGVVVATPFGLMALAREFIEDRWALVGVGITPFTIMSMTLLPWRGYKAKFFAMGAAILAIYLYRNDRPFSAGAAAAAAVGFWQLNVIIPIVVVVGLYFRGGVTAAAKAITGGLVLTVLMVLPILATGSTIQALIVQSVFVPLIAGEAMTLADRGTILLSTFGPSLIAALMGAVGIVYLWRDREGHPPVWLVVCALWYAAGLAFDLDSGDDLLLLLCILAIGVGTFIAKLSPRGKRAAIVSLLLMSMVSPVWVYGVGWQYLDVDRDIGGDPPDEFKDVKTIYINQDVPDRCHIRLSGTEQSWIVKTEHSWRETQCGWISRETLSRELGLNTSAFSR